MRKASRTIATATAAALFGSLILAASSAQAAFHEMKIREVFPSGAAAETSFVELQMYSPGQNFLSTHHLRTYNASGGTVSETALADVANGQSQASVLIGDTAVAGPDFAEGALNNLTPTGGAACYMDSIGFNTAVDCVSWGTFTDAGMLLPTNAPASSTGNPALPAGIPMGSSITRSIAPGCSTLLEAADDTGDSATDFSATGPTPRNNAGAITEMACLSPVTPITPTPTSTPPKKCKKGQKLRKGKCVKKKKKKKRKKK